MNGGSTSNRTRPHRQLPRMLLLIHDSHQATINSQLVEVADRNTALAPSSPFSSVGRESDRLSFNFLLKFARLLAFRRVNISRVIYLDQHAVVAACECMRPSKYRGREIARELRREIERCVDEGLAIFPYSEV